LSYKTDSEQTNSRRRLYLLKLFIRVYSRLFDLDPARLVSFFF